MQRTRLLLAIAAILWSAVTAGTQTPTGALSTELRAHLKGEQFEIVTAVRGLPLGVRDGLQTLFGGSLDIANPGAAFQGAGQTANANLPLRRLVAAGCSRDSHHCLVYYERGGGAPTWRVTLFHWTPAATRFEWGAVAPGGLKTIEDVQKAILSDAILNGATLW
jgi:hypothetical protein